MHSLSHLWERAGVRVILSLPRWGRVKANPMHPHYLPDHRLCVLLLPLVGEGRGEGDSFPPPLGEGEGGGQPGICCFTCSYSGACPAPIPAFPQRGKERRPEGTEQRWAGGRSTFTLTLSRKRERDQEIPPPLGEGVGGGQPGFAAAPAHIQGRARPPSLPSPSGGRREDQREEAVPSP